MDDSSSKDNGKAWQSSFRNAPLEPGRMTAKHSNQDNSNEELTVERQYRQKQFTTKNADLPEHKMF